MNQTNIFSNLHFSVFAGNTEIYSVNDQSQYWKIQTTTISVLRYFSPSVLCLLLLYDVSKQVTQLASTFPKLTIETLEQGVKYVQT